MLNQIITEETQKICRRYKIGEEKVRYILEDKITGSFLLSEKIKQAKNYEQLKKSAVYRKFIKKIRQEVYYGLRRYHQNEGAEKAAVGKLEEFVKNNGRIGSAEWNEIKKELIALHISALEREAGIDDFNRQILEIVRNDKIILDLGSGIYPLSFPFIEAPKLKKYICLEKDKKAAAILKLFGRMLNSKLEVFNENIGEHEWDRYLSQNQNSFDTVFMFKLIPVVSRQERGLLEILIKVPAKRMIITANKEAMTKKQNIARREDGALKRFIKLTGRTIVKKLDFVNEFGYVIE